MIHFGQRLKERRDALVLTQRDVAALAGVSVNTISSAEQSPTCNINQNSLRRICNALQITESEMRELWATKKPRLDPNRPAGSAEVSYEGGADQNGQSGGETSRRGTGSQQQPEAGAKREKSR